MVFEDYKTKQSVAIVYTGEGKGKTSASLGLMVRALGAGWRVAYIQFIKHWQVSEHQFITDIKPIHDKKLFFYKGGKGFYNAGYISAEAISQADHKKAAHDTYQIALDCVTNGKFDLVICDEINNAVADKLLTKAQLQKIINSRSKDTSICLTGRNFPEDLLDKIDIATHMTKMKHHYDDKFLANEGIDY